MPLNRNARFFQLWCRCRVMIGIVSIFLATDSFGAQELQVAEVLIDGQSARNPTQVDNLTHSINPSPVISWTTGPAGAVQSAWQVQVRTGHSGAGNVIWDSGQVTGSTGQTVCGATLLRGISYYARVRVSGNGTWSDWTEQRCRRNIPPGAPIVQVEPGDQVGPQDELHGVAMATDDDGDSITCEYEWLRGGTASGQTGRILTAGHLTAGESWKLRSRARDGWEAGPWAESASVQVQAEIWHKPVIQYDANGNMIRKEERGFEYDAENRLRRIRDGGVVTGEYWYGGGEQRVKKVESGRATLYYGEHYELAGDAASTPTETTKYCFAGTRRVAEIDPQGQVTFYHADHLGGANVVTNDAGTQMAINEYYPFGPDRVQSGQKSVVKKYTGKENDLSGIYYYGARYYNPSSFTFISADSIIPDQSIPQSYNRFSYVQNNPIKFIDPDGHYLFLFSGLPEKYAKDSWDPNVSYTGPGPWAAVIDPLLKMTTGIDYAPAGFEHDRGYGEYGRSKTVTDFEFLANQITLVAKSKVSKEQKILGTAVSFVTFAAVVVKGGESYRNAQPSIPDRSSNLTYVGTTNTKGLDLGLKIGTNMSISTPSVIKNSSKGQSAGAGKTGSSTNTAQYISTLKQLISVMQQYVSVLQRNSSSSTSVGSSGGKKR